MKVLVTGAAHGLGRALTEQLLANGHEVVAVDRDIEPLEKLALKHRGACLAGFADLQKVESVESLLVRQHGNKFDLVILNAGISATGKFEEIPPEAYDRLISVNLFAPLHLASRLVGNDLMSAKSKIVFISSLSHAVGYPGGAVYAATKDAIASYARSISKPFHKKRVSVLTVFPGPIDTGHAEKHSPHGSSRSKRMAPDKLARLILRASRGRSKILYPGGKTYLAALFGRLFPGLATRLMRRGLYDKMAGPSY